MLLAIPLLAIVVVIWNILAFATGGALAGQLLAFGTPSGATLALTTGEALVGLGIVLLYLEILKSTRTGAASIVDHIFSMALFVIVLLELILVPGFATGAYALVMLLTLIDVIAGFTVTISTARRDIGLGNRIG